MEFGIDIEGWPGGDWPALTERAVEAVAGEVAALANPRLTVSLLFTTDEQVHALNREWRAKDKPTNVLSFPMLTGDELRDLTSDGPPAMPPVPLGDLALAFETCSREAEEKTIALEDHAAHLIVHGLLHLAGYDHETSDADAEEMEAIEVKALARMGIGDPYDAPDATKRDS